MDSPMETPDGNSYKKWKFSQENPRAPRLSAALQQYIRFHTNKRAEPSIVETEHRYCLLFVLLTALSSSTARINTNRTEHAEHLHNLESHRTRDMSFALVVVCVFPILYTRFTAMWTEKKSARALRFVLKSGIRLSLNCYKSNVSFGFWISRWTVILRIEA